MATDIFEPLFDASILCDAVTATLRAWMPTYLQEIEVQRGWTRGRIPSPRTYASRVDFETFSDDMIPIIVVICPGTVERPISDGEGRFSGWWALGVGVVAGANTEGNSDRVAKVYAAAVRAILLQHSALDDSWEFSGVEFYEESYDEVPDPTQERMLRAARLLFQVRVENIVNKYGGPMYPIAPDSETQPGSDWPTVETAEATVQIVEEVQRG